jgi:hypothetical protein
MRSIFIPYLLISLMINGCNSKNHSKIEQYNISLSQSEINPISDIVSDINYILLNVEGENILAQPYKIFFSPNQIFIEDRNLNNLLIFDNLGNFQHSISSTGQGPTEFEILEDFIVSADKVYIKDKKLNKILTYDLMGRYLEEEKNTLNGSNFYKGSDYVLEYMDNKTHMENFNFIRFNRDNINGYIDIKKGFENLRFSDQNGFIANLEKNELIFNIPYTFEIAVFNSLGHLKNHIKYDLGKDAISDVMRISQKFSRDRNEFVKENNLTEQIGFFAHRPNGYMMNIQQGLKDNHFFLLNADFEVRYQAKNFINDIDGLNLKIYPWTFTERGFVCLFSSKDIFNSYIENFKGKKVSIGKNDIHAFFDRNREKLKDDNFVLVEFVLKQDI